MRFSNMHADLWPECTRDELAASTLFIKPSDDAVDLQHGKDIATILSLCLGDEYLDPLVEAKQTFGAGPVAQGGIKREQQVHT